MMQVYFIRNNISNNWYVGATTRSLKERWKGHCNDAYYEENTTRALQRAIRKYGTEAFTIETLLDGFQTEEEMFEAEICAIALFRVIEERPGYNETAGGEGCSGHIQTYSTRRKMSDAQVKRWSLLSEQRIIKDSREQPLDGTEEYISRGLSQVDHITLNNLVDKLPSEDQEFVDLKMQGYSNEELAEQYKISVGAVKMRYSRIVDKLKTFVR